MQENKQLTITFNSLPISVNQYLKPSATYKNGKVFSHMYESKESKVWKKSFQAYLKKLVEKQGWDKSITASGHWYLDCVFIQSRTNQDNNNYYKILLDSMTGIVFEDDKNILVRTQRVAYDSKNPRFVAVLKPVEYIGIFKDEATHIEFQAHNCSLCSKNQDKCSILKKAREGRMQAEITHNNSYFVCEKMKEKKK